MVTPLIDSAEPTEPSARIDPALPDPVVRVRPLSDRVVSIALYGEVDLATADPLRRAVDSASAGPWPALLIDLSRATFIDATGIGLLCRARKAMLGRHGRLAVACDVPQILTVLRVTKLIRALNVAPSPDEALARLNSRHRLRLAAAAA